jgi:hypothetical protein
MICVSINVPTVGEAPYLESKASFSPATVVCELMAQIQGSKMVGRFSQVWHVRWKHGQNLVDDTIAISARNL